MKVSHNILITITISLILIVFFLNLLLCDYMATTPLPQPLEITFFFFSLSDNCSGVSIKRHCKYVSK